MPINQLLTVVSLTFISLIVYLNTLGHQFIGYDDFRLITDNPFIADFSNIKKLLPPAYFDLANVPNLIRPVSIASIMLDYEIWGLNPFGYHLTNVLLHTLAVILSYALVTTLFGKKKLAFFTALLFALHPIHTENVNHISFRQDILAFIFLAVAMITFIKSRQVKKMAQLILLTASFIATALALFAKESAIILPILLLTYEWLFVFKGKKIAFKEIIRYLPIFLLIIFYLILRSQRFEYIFPDDASGLGVQSTATQLEGFALIINTIFIYLKVLLVPINLMADYGYGVLGETSISNAKTIGQLVIIIVPLFLAVYFMRKQKIVSFGIFWVYISLIPVSNIMKLFNPIAERYLYLPSLGFVLLVASLIHSLMKFRPRIAYTLLLLICVFYGYVTFQRNLDWHDNLIFWQKTYAANPASFRTTNNLAAAYIDSNTNLEKAIQLLKPLTSSQTFELTPYYNLANVYLITCRNSDAMEVLYKVIRINPTDPTPYWLLALAYRFEGFPTLESKNLQIAKNLQPYFKPSYVDLVIRQRRDCK